MPLWWLLDPLIPKLPMEFETLVVFNHFWSKKENPESYQAPTVPLDSIMFCWHGWKTDFKMLSFYLSTARNGVTTACYQTLTVSRCCCSLADRCLLCIALLSRVSWPMLLRESVIFLLKAQRSPGGIRRERAQWRSARPIRPLGGRITFCMLLVSFSGVPVRPNSVGRCHCQWEMFPRTGRCCVLRWARLLVSSRTVTILLSECSGFTACFPVRVQNRADLSQRCDCCVAVLTPFSTQLSSSRFPQRPQNTGGLEMALQGIQE